MLCGGVANSRTHNGLVVSQAYSVVRYLFNYPIPVAVFAYCYGHIFHTIRRQSKVVTGHAGRGQGATTGGATSGNQTSGQTQQQGTAAAAATGGGLSQSYSIDGQVDIFHNPTQSKPNM